MITLMTWFNKMLILETITLFKQLFCPDSNAKAHLITRIFSQVLADLPKGFANLCSNLSKMCSSHEA